jgi:hypothetical protein
MSVTSDGVAVIDCDSHISEPADLWTSRLPRKLRDAAPHLVLDESTGRTRWQVGDKLLTANGTGAYAG